MFNLRKSKEEIERLKMHREQQNRILEQQRSKEIENKKAEEQKIANQVRVFCIRDRIARANSLKNFTNDIISKFLNH